MAATYLNLWSGGIALSSGAPAPLMPVSVYVIFTGTLATLYAEPGSVPYPIAGAATISNPISTDANGNLRFWAVPGQYQLKVGGVAIQEVAVADDPADAGGGGGGVSQGYVDTHLAGTAISAPGAVGDAYVWNGSAWVATVLGSAAYQALTAFDAAGSATTAAAPKASFITTVATVTMGAALGLNDLTPVDASGGGITMTLPVGAALGTWIGCLKSDSTPNFVTVSGSIRGVGASSVNLELQYETILLIADNTGSWWPLISDKTLASLDARYGLPKGVVGSAVVATVAPLPTYSATSTVLTMTANGVLTIDGYDVVLNDTVLVMSEVNDQYQGLYTCTTEGTVSVPAVLTRSKYMDTAAQIPGALVPVEAGSVNAGTLWMVQGNGPFTLGTTPIDFVPLTGSSSGGVAIGQQAAYSSITASVSQALTAGVWTQVAGAPSVTLPNDGNTYRIECTIPAAESSAIGNVQLGLGKSASAIYAGIYRNFGATATPYSAGPLEAQNVSGGGQTITIYAFSDSTPTITLMAGPGSA